LSRRVAVPIWRDPWMVVGARTFTGDVLARLGLDNVFGAGPDRYPHVEAEHIRAAAPDLVLLPAAPSPFTPGDGPGGFPAHRATPPPPGVRGAPRRPRSGLPRSALRRPARAPPRPGPPGPATGRSRSAAPPAARTGSARSPNAAAQSSPISAAGTCQSALSPR